MLKECSRTSRRNVGNLEPIDLPTGAASDEGKELLQRVPIALLSVTGEIVLTTRYSSKSGESKGLVGHSYS